MDKMNRCEKCRKLIHGRMIYAGGAVWHKECYPYKKSSTKTKRRK